MKQKVDVCLSPQLLYQHELEGYAVVVADIFRATSCMVAGLANGVKSIRPVMEVEECQTLQIQGYLAGGERHAQKIEGFDLDNSPFSYMSLEVKGKDIAMTTTNGTRSIALAKDKASQILAAAFLNLKSTTSYLLQQNENVLVVCAGWKGRPCLEDTLFAGALAANLQKQGYISVEDTTKMAVTLYKEAKGDLLAFLQDASHLKRLRNLSSGEDIPFCLNLDVFDVVVRLENDHLVLV